MPALAFVVERDRITILNNESGFQEENVRAICDVGRTTKGKHQYGYIGNSTVAALKSALKITVVGRKRWHPLHIKTQQLKLKLAKVRA